MGTTGLTVRITHPFHPLNGQTFEMISHGAHWGETRVVYRADCPQMPKILALTDALGNLVRFVLLPGNRFDTVGVAPLIKGMTFDALLGEKAYDSNWIIEELNARGALICISQRQQRKEPLEIDPVIYCWRHLIKNFFCNLKYFRRIAMRSDKTDISFSAMIYACAALINSQ